MLSRSRGACDRLRWRAFASGAWHSIKVQINPGGWACYIVDGVFFGCTGLTMGERRAFRDVLATLAPRVHVGMVTYESSYSFRNVLVRWRDGLLLPRYVAMTDEQRRGVILGWRVAFGNDIGFVHDSDSEDAAG